MEQVNFIDHRFLAKIHNFHNLYLELFHLIILENNIYMGEINTFEQYKCSSNGSILNAQLTTELIVQ